MVQVKYVGIEVEPGHDRVRINPSPGRIEIRQTYGLGDGVGSISGRGCGYGWACGCGDYPGNNPDDNPGDGFGDGAGEISGEGLGGGWGSGNAETSGVDWTTPEEKPNPQLDKVLDFMQYGDAKSVGPEKPPGVRDE